MKNHYFMKKYSVLHITGNKIEASNGIGRLLPEMIEMLNSHSSLFTHALCSVRDKYTSDIFKVYSLNEITEDVINQYDLFIFHGLYFFEYLPFYLKILRAGKKYLIKPHSSLMIAGQKKSKIKKIFANVFLFKRFVRKSSGVLFINEDERKNSLQWNIVSFIDKNGIAPSSSKRPFFSDSSLPMRFIYLSRIDFSHKGTDILLDALDILNARSELNSIEVYIYGVGKESEVDMLSKRIQMINHPNLKFFGPLFGDDKYLTLSTMDVFLLTSRYEGFPMAVLEALDVGLPCLVTKGVNMTSILSDHNIGWECLSDPLDVARMIADISKFDRSVINEMSTSAHNYVADGHYWPVISERSDLLFLNILGSR